MRIYEEMAEDSPRSQRADERALMLRAVGLLEAAAAEPDPAGRRQAEAIAFTHRLWSALLLDLASPGNTFPDDLKARLISIGLFVLASLEDARGGRLDGLEAVRDVSRTMAEALQ